MSSPSFDLSKVQFTSAANSFKNDGELYTGSLTLSDPIAAGTTLTSSTTTPLTNLPQFSMLYAYYQEATDKLQQYAVGSGYNTEKWYPTSVNNKIGVRINSGPSINTVLVGVMYAIINGSNVTVEVKIPNSTASTVNYDAITIPWAFFCYTLTN